MTRLPAGEAVLAVDRLGHGRPTLVLHGGGPGCTSRNDFAAVADRVQAGRELIFVDLAQFGWSDAPFIDDGLFGFHARSVTALLDGLRLTGTDILAQSLGGSVALLLAARRPDLVRRIVATGSQPIPFASPDDHRASLGRRVREEYYGNGGSPRRPAQEAMRRLLASVEWYDGDRIPDDLVARRHEASVLPGPLRFGVDHAGRGLPQDLSADLTDVASEVLLIWGAEDPFSDPRYASEVAAILPRARVEVIEAASHHPQSEHPELYARLAREFLDGGL